MRLPILIDTQLLVLLAVGATSVRIIRKHKNLTAFMDQDFDLLLRLIGPEPELVLLPNTVSEAANLLRHHRDPEKSAVMETFKGILTANAERYVPSADVAARDEYRRLGLTDTAILECPGGPFEILTADAGLYLAALNRGMRAINFNHKREEFGLL